MTKAARQLCENAHFGQTAAKSTPNNDKVTFSMSEYIVKQNSTNHYTVGKLV